MTKMRHGYSDSDRSTDHPGGGKSMTRQNHKEECDINTIVERHLEVGGVITPMEFSDKVVVLPENFDYHEALNSVIAADEAFMQLPADIRTAHENDAGKLLDHVASKPFIDGDVDIYGEPIAVAPVEPATPSVDPVTPDPAQ